LFCGQYGAPFVEVNHRSLSRFGVFVEENPGQYQEGEGRAKED